MSVLHLSVIITICLVVPRAVYAQFLGGTNDGHSDLKSINTICSAGAVNPFIGGGAGGHSDIKSINTICSLSAVNLFKGGVADGHSDIKSINTICSVVAVNPFIGGIADGYSDLKLISTVCSVVGVNPFIGGIADGYSDSKLISTVCSVVGVNPFIGGIANGYSDIKSINTVCSIIAVNPFKGGNADGHSDIQLLRSNPTTCALLPIELLFFRAECDKKKVIIYWATASQLNNDFFTIERANESLKFEELIKMNGAPNSRATITYSYTDENSLNDISYYRLKQTDTNGNFEYFQIITSECKSDILTISIYPNPNNGHFMIDGIKEKTTITLYSSLGNVIANKDIYPSNSELEFTNLADGIYYVQLSSNGKNTFKKIIIKN